VLLSARGLSHDLAPLARLVPPGSEARSRTRARALRRIRVPELERTWESVAVCHNSIVGISRGLAVPAAAIFSDYSIAPTEEKKNHSILFLPHRSKRALLDCYTAAFNTIVINSQIIQN